MTFNQLMKKTSTTSIVKQVLKANQGRILGMVLVECQSDEPESLVIKL